MVVMSAVADSLLGVEMILEIGAAAAVGGKEKNLVRVKAVRGSMNAGLCCCWWKWGERRGNG